MTRWLINWWRRHGVGSARYTTISVATTQDEIRRPLHPRTVWVIAAADRDKWCVFTCPCGRSHVIMLNLDTHRTPNWHVNRNTLTVSPSIDSFELGRCHFWLREGHVQWVTDSQH